MLDHPPTDDDALADAEAELLADAWVEQAARDARLCRLALRAVGLAKHPADMTRREFCQEFALSQSELRRMECLFKARLATSILQDPEAPPHLAKLALSAFKEHRTSNAQH